MSDFKNILNLDSLMPRERERADAISVPFQIAMATEFGDRLDPIFMPKLKAGFFNRSEVFRHLVTGQTDEFDPADSKAVRKIVRETVKAHTLASRALTLQDEKRKIELRDKFINGLSIAKRISMARAGSLEQAADNYVQKQLDLEASQC